MPSYILCDTPDSVQSAYEALSHSDYLIFDCEGEHLGTRGGKLALIILSNTISSPHSNTDKVYIIDALMSGGNSLVPIFDLLQSDQIVKVVFDGRMDYSCMLYEHGVTIINVLDMQLADVKSRRLRGESIKHQQQRLRSYLSQNEVDRNKAFYSQVVKLSGLNECIKEHKIAVTTKEKVDHDKWLHRPLTKNQLEYATADATLIGELFLCFRRLGYLNGQLDIESQRYISLWSDAQPALNDKYRRHALLPLDILAYVDCNAGDKKNCKHCRRYLRRSCFWNPEKGNICLVCRTINIRIGIVGISRKMKRK